MLGTHPRLLVNHTLDWRKRIAKAYSNPLKSAIPALSHFDAATERLFWQEQHTETVTTLKSALLLGAAGFLAFVILDIASKDLPLPQILGRLLIVLALCSLFLHLHRHSRPYAQVSRVVRISISLSVINMLGILLVDGNPASYIEIWPGLLPIYFFTYGQLMLPFIDTILFGWLSMLAFMVAGYLIDAQVLSLVPSLVLLTIVNLFGLCTRCQLEIHSRNSFKERRKAEQAAHDKTLFLRQVSHNLRQPLQALSCYSSLLDSAFANKHGDPLQRISSKMGGAIDELNNAFNHVLDIANLETGKQIPLLTTFDINVLLATLEDRFVPQAAQRGLKLKIRLRALPPYNVYSDAYILSQVISNLIDNALKYTRSGWILVGTVKLKGNRLKLHIYDTGIGIADQQKQIIFKEFYRGHRRQEDPNTNGLGIGLAYVLKALESLPDHSLEVYSIPNRGSDFQLSLPVAIAPSNCTWLTNQYNNLSGNFVFIVDDDHDVLNALSEQITSWGCIVQKASSISETLKLLADNIRSPDLLITDFYLKDNETAHDVITTLENECGPVPILILSAHAIPEQDKARFPANTHLLRKPANATVLLETMAKAMGQ